MRKLLMQVVLVLLFPVAMMAQEYPRAELFGGYSYFRPEGGDPNFHGWNAAIAGNLNHWFGLVADLSGHYARETVSVPDPVGGLIEAKADASLHALFFGPRFSFRGNERTVAFVQALLGGARSSAEFQLTAPGFFLRESESETAFGMTAGIGVDVTLGTSIALRLFQIEYELTTFGGDPENNQRVSTGLVFRFGSR